MMLQKYRPQFADLQFSDQLRGGKHAESPVNHNYLNPDYNYKKKSNTPPPIHYIPPSFVEECPNSDAALTYIHPYKQ